MYKFDKNHQFGLADFNQPMGLKMNPENRWVKKAEKIPWEAIEEKYAALFPGKKGMPAKPLRTALGSLLIQKQLQFSDRELVEEIRENPYFQYFIGLPGYQDTIPFVPSLLVEFRKRLTAEVLEEIDLCDDLSKQLATIRTLVEQQQYMYENKVHSVPDRIVSISQPYIRPIANLEEICKVNDALEEAKIKFAVLKGAFFGCEMYEKGTRRSNDIDLLVYEDDLGKLDTCLRAMGYIQSNMSNGEMVEATKKEKIIQRMNYHDLVPYVKKTKMGILELDINFLFDGNKNLIDKNVYEMGTMVYKGRYRITGLNPYTNLAFLCCHFYREATDTIWTEGKRDVTLYKIVDMMNFIRFYREQINYDIMIEVLKKLNIEKKAYFTFKIMTEF